MKVAKENAVAVALTAAYAVKHFGSESYPGFLHKVLKELMVAGPTEAQQSLGNALAWTQKSMEEANTGLCQYVVVGCKSLDLQIKVKALTCQVA